MTRVPRAGLELAVLEGPDAGRSFRFSRDEPVNLRRRSDPDDEGLALRTDEADGTHVVLCRTASGFAVERRVGPALEWNGVVCERADLRDGDLLRIGGTVLAVSVFADTASPQGAVVPDLPDQVAGYDGLELVAEGAGARTYRARRASDGTPVALKIVAADAGPAARRDLRRAAEIAALLAGHPHAAQLVAADVEAGAPWLALRWVEGESVEELVEREGPLAIADACAVAAQMLGVLGVIHGCGHIHRDLHPGNVLWSDRSAPGSVDAVLIDFGLGKAVRAEAGETTLHPTQTGEWMGRPRFMAPEQAADGKHVGPAADLYGLASTVYWMLCREPVVRELPGESILAAWARGHRVPIRRRRPDVPESLAVALDRVLARDPVVRWGGLGPFREEVTRLATSNPEE